MKCTGVDKEACDAAFALPPKSPATRFLILSTSNITSIKTILNIVNYQLASISSATSGENLHPVH